MKKIFILLLLVAALAACEKESTKVDYTKFKAILNPMTPTQMTTRQLLKAMTNSQVYDSATVIMWDKRWIGTIWKDTINRQIFLPPQYIIFEDGTWVNEFIKGRDVVIRNKLEVIAYIPNAIMDDGQRLITNAYNAGKIDSCLWYLKNIYKWIPITNDDWVKLEANNQN